MQMKIIQVNEGKVVDIMRARDDATTENIIVVSEIPVCEPQEGYNGVLMYSADAGLYWEYDAVPTDEEISNEELGLMVKEEVL